MESLEMLANNVANSTTVAFKADREFYGAYVTEAMESPVIDKQWTDFSQGTLVTTGNPLDLAINGPGFFAVDSPTGPLYTRNGNFHIGPAGQIQTQDGSTLRVRTPDGRPLKLDPAKPVEIGVGGIIRQEGQTLGSIETFGIENANAISKRGNTYFQWLDAAPPKLSTAEIRQGAIENSNVPVAESAVRLVSVMRQFEMLQRAMSLGGDMNRRIDEIAKVS